MNVVILMGAPGSGKGSSAKLLQKKLSLPHLSTGDLLREEVSQKTQLGLKVEELINDGKLISDDLMAELISNRIKQNDCTNGFILDGFPRTVVQAHILDKMFANLKIKDYIVVDLIVDHDTLVKRILGRYICSKCGAIYNEYFASTKIEGKCDICGNGSFTKRKDDNLATIEKRLCIYAKETVPVIQYYKENNKLFNVDGVLSKNIIVEKVLDILNKFKKVC